MKAKLLISLGTVAIILSILANQSYSAAATGEIVDFGQKVLIISSRSNSDYGARITDVRVRNLAGQQYLVGTAVDDGHPNDWQRGRTVWVAVNDIAQMTEFDSVEQYVKPAKNK